MVSANVSEASDRPGPAEGSTPLRGPGAGDDPAARLAGAPAPADRAAGAGASNRLLTGAVARATGKAGLVEGGLAVVVASWWGASLYVVGTTTLPTPAEVLEAILELLPSGALVRHFSASVGVICFGFAIGAAAGLPTGILIGRSRYWQILLEGPIMVLVSLPGLAFGVLMLAAFGLGPTGPVVAAALVAMPYVAINVAEGIRAVDRDLLRMSQSYRCSRAEIVRHVLIPSILPYLFASLRYAFAQGWKIVAIVEVFGATAGIGFMIRATYQSYAVDGMLAWTISFIALML